MRLALAVSALFLVVAPLQAQKTAPSKTSSRTAQAAASDTTKKGVKQAGTKRSPAKAAATKPSTPKVATTKSSSTKGARSNAKAPKTDAPKKETAKAAPRKAENTAPVSNGGGQYVGSKQGHTYYLATCKAAQSLTPANRVQFPSEADAKKAGYAHSKQKGC